MSPSAERARKPGGPSSSPGLRRRLAAVLDPLTVRLAVGIAALVLLPLGLGFWAFSEHHYERTVARHVRAGELQGRILEAALRHQMVDHTDPELMATILSEIGDQPTVRTVMILNHDGEVRIANRPELVGRVFPRTSPSCVACHAKEPKARERWVVLDEGEEQVLRTVQPIENRSECFGCHPPERRLNGILITDTSLAGAQAELDADALAFVLGTSAVSILLLAGVGLFVRRLVLTRLRRLGRTARDLASGDLHQRAKIEGGDVITDLAQDFNSMAETVSALIDEVRSQEEQLVSIMDSLDDGLVVLDRDSRVLAANRSFCRRLGAHPGELGGRSCHDGISEGLPCCAGSGDCPALRCMATGEVQRAVFQSSADDGGRLLVEEVHASPVYDDEGRVVQVVEIWRDISRRVEEEQRLAEIEHLVALGTLASGFSHEVNTPLASILTSAESILDQVGDRAEDETPGEELLSAVRRGAELVREQVLRCRAITRQFLRFSRGIPPSLEPVDLAEVVRGVVGLVEGTARERRVTLEVREDGRLPAVRANTEVVQHVVLNLLVNAIQANDDGGGRVVVGFDVGETVRILVQDDGCGVPPESRSHLFEPFRSRKAGGTGLGLFLSRSFMRRFGGDVRLVHSALGKGTCFEIVLERAEEAVP